MPAKKAAALPEAPSRSFRARIGGEDGSDESRGEVAFLELAFDVKAAFGKARPPVIVEVNGYAYPSTVAVYAGTSYLPVRRSHREAAKVNVADEVDVVVTLDTSERKVEAPADLVKALRANKGAKAAWDALSFTHQKEHADAIEQAKKPETRARRIEKAIEMLLAKAR